MESLLTLQSGVVARRQLVDVGLMPNDVRRLLRRRDLVPLHPGVYVNHTGEPTWLQQAWGAVLLHPPAALSHDSALRVTDGPGRIALPGPIHVAVDRGRRHDALPGIRLHRMAGLDDRVLWNASPPRVRIEEALVDLAAGARDDMAAIAVLADAVQARRTTPARVRAALHGRTRVARRAFLDAVLDDIATGTGSVLEHGYLTRVERPHGLPVGQRQVRSRPFYRDLLYAGQAQVVELDGRAFHDSARQRDADLDRDLDSAIDGLSTVRLGWGQVFGRPCHTAERVGALLRTRGWSGRPRSCRDCA
ncbi:hypothetical protein [Nocardioides gilvus]|uniref:hypothetical protein n=1 Tax=Nocardioides gilvus TaxID=1735589 RepID=UPI000D74610B|nr:hypothetical protein [Nocardioides gilvus]